MLALSQNIDKELYFIYGLIGLVVILIIAIVVIDMIDSKKAKKKKKVLSDTLSMRPVKEDNLVDTKIDRKDEKIKTEKAKINVEKKVKVVKEEVEEPEEEEEEQYEEPELEKTQAQIRVEEITNALKDAGLDSEEDFSKYEEFEDEQEKNAIISYSDLMDNYDRLYAESEKNQYIDDNTIPINIKELYDLSEEETATINKKRKTVDDLSFKRTPYISPVYGIQRAPEENMIDRDIENGNKFLKNLKELKGNLE